MPPKVTKKINQDFFKEWSSDMAYVLGFFVADGCITLSKGRENNPYTFNITSKDLEHLHKINKALSSDYKIGKKSNGRSDIAYQINIRNSVIASDLIKLGVHTRKTYNLESLEIPNRYFSDFTRGFFDGDGSVYIYKVNRTTQIKVGFVSVSLSFINQFNKQLCRNLAIPLKSVHKFISQKDERMIQFRINFYISDCEKLYEFMYKSSSLFLDRKHAIFRKWEKIKYENRRHYIKNNYPSKIGWQLNSNISI